MKEDRSRLIRLPAAQEMNKWKCQCGHFQFSEVLSHHDYLGTDSEVSL
jgi:hypothetical protein